MKLLKNSLAILALTSIVGSASAANYAWPEKFEGVMLQGFYWDSYSGTDNTKWTTLTNKSDELSKYFKVIWVPNSAKAASNPGMGYDPVYWFTNHNTAFGTEAQLRTMIKTFKEKGTDIIEDVVINHRSGVSNWTNFPAETWNGVKYQLGPQHICSNDEVAWATGQAKPTGAPDTGENFDGSRDLDHTNAEVQNNCKNYCKFLIEDLGYAGFRYDMVKGYSGQYNKIYNEYSKPKYSVGEYWDGNYDAVAAWIEATGKQSAAFDFPCKYAINEAFHSGDLTKLVWTANGTTPQPAGLIHWWYPQYAVTFIDNHDTYRDGSKFKGNVVAANAFILCSPGTPCVFWPHYSQYKSEIQALIDVRNACGIHNQSSVKVLKSTRDCYMAEVTGTKGTLVVKIGGAMESPAGYSNSDIRATGTDYCVWSHTSGGTHVDPPIPSGEKFKVYFDNSSTKWVTPYIYYWPTESPKWPGVEMTKTEGNVWEYTVPAGTTGIIFNAGDGDATKTEDLTAQANHIYTKAGDQGIYNGGGHGGDDPIDPDKYPATLYLIGNVNGMAWASAHAIPQSKVDNGFYTWDSVTFDDSKDGYAYFSFLTKLDEADGDWNNANQSDRYGASTKDEALSASATIRKFAYMVDAMSCNAWKVKPGVYSVTADLRNMKLTLSSPTGVEEIVISLGEAPVYFNLQGVRVENPENGIFIMVKDGKTSKVVLRR